MDVTGSHICFDFLDVGRSSLHADGYGENKVDTLYFGRVNLHYELLGLPAQSMLSPLHLPFHQKLIRRTCVFRRPIPLCLPLPGFCRQPPSSVTPWTKFSHSPRSLPTGFEDD